MLTLKRKEGRLNVRDMVLIAAQKLRNIGLTTAELDARILIAEALSCTQEDLLRNSTALLSLYEIEEIEQLIERKKNHEPVAKIIGRKEFFGRDFVTNHHTLDPRPDTETLIEAVFSVVPDRNGDISIGDFGTGTGILAITLLKEFPLSKAIAVDISAEALIVAAENSQKHSVNARIKLLQADWREKNFSATFNQKFDLIVSNPPYVKATDIESLLPETRFDPNIALDGGVDGLDCYRVQLPLFAQILKSDGAVVLEVGAGQHEDVAVIAKEAGFTNIEIKKDLAQIARCLIIKKV